MGTSDEIFVSLSLELSIDGTTYQSAVTCNVDTSTLIHKYNGGKFSFKVVVDGKSSLL